MLAEFVKPPALPPGSPSSSEIAIPWYFKPGMLVVAFLVVGPFMLPLLWFNPHMRLQMKLVWTVVISLVSLVLILVTVKAIETLAEFYRLMGP
ncbi:MAG: hypothetical protein L0Z50_06215 [Verrucomicrobiales bacterium]|nr:hypothetical protein [Verrucomicrobiales bacterium]